jgi:hypothetical protein
MSPWRSPPARVENGDGAKVDRTVETMLLVKTEGKWRIAAQAWDKASPSNPVPDRLMVGAVEPSARP